MILLDENFPESQRQLLRGWRIRPQQVGYETGRKGMQDEEIIPFLHQLRRPTFFTLDDDFYQRDLCHAGYCLVFINGGQYEAASFVRRILRHRQFNTQAKRMGTVMRVSHIGITVWYLHAEEEVFVEWTD
jgi:hypothetical protein